MVQAYQIELCDRCGYSFRHISASLEFEVFFFFFKFFFFLCELFFFKFLLNLLQYCFCFMFWFFSFLFFGPEACGILALPPGIKPTPPALEGEVLTSGPPGKSQIILIITSHCWKIGRFGLGK